VARNPQSMRSSLAVVRGLGSARSGTSEFWHQRLTGIALVPLTIAFVWIIVSMIGKDYNTMRRILANPLAAILLLLFILSGIHHMQIGMRVIIEDYIHREGAKIAALIANAFFAVLVGFVALFAVLKICFS